MNSLKRVGFELLLLLLLWGCCWVVVVFLCGGGVKQLTKTACFLSNLNPDLVHVGVKETNIYDAFDGTLKQNYGK